MWLMPQRSPGTILAWGADRGGRRLSHTETAAGQGTSLKATCSVS